MTAERRITLKTDIQGANQVDSLQKALATIKNQSTDSTRGLSQLGDALTQRTIPPLQEYKKLWDSSGPAVMAFGGMAATSLSKLNQEFQRQKTLGEFYGTGTMRTSLLSLNNATREFLSGGGRGFTSWLEGAGSRLSQYRLALAGAAAGMAAFGAAAAFSAKNTGNMIDSVMKIHQYRIADEDKTRAWLESALDTDWSGGRKERSTVYGTLMSKRIMNEQTAISTTEAIEKYWFANKEYLSTQGVSSSEDLANILMSDSGNEEQLRAITSKYNLNKVPAFKRGAIMQQLAADLDMGAEVDKRPEEVLKKRLEHATTNIGKTLIPVLNQILGAFLKLSEVLGKIPGADKMAGWGIVLVGGVATLTMLLPLLSSMLATVRLLVPAIKLVGVAMRGALIGTGVGALLVAGALLAGFLYKTGMLQKAWDKFKGSNIGASFAKGLAVAGEYAEKLAGHVGATFDKLDKAYSKGGLGGALKMALEFSSPMFKIFTLIGERVKQLVDKSDALNKIAKVGATLTQKIHDFIQKLLGVISGVKSGIDNLLSQIPGAEKRESRAKLDESARKLGLKYVGDGQFTYMNDVPVPAEELQAGGKYEALGQQATEHEGIPGFFGALLNSLKLLIPGAKKEQLRETWMATVPEGWEYDPATQRYANPAVTGSNTEMYKGVRYGSSGFTLEDFHKLTPEVGAAYRAYELEPSLAQGIADAVTSALDRWVPDFDIEIPSMDSLTEAIKNWNLPGGNNIASYSSGTGNNPLVAGETWLVSPEGVRSMRKDKFDEISATAQQNLLDAGYSWVEYPPLDAGGQILSTGPLIGHGGEEIIPANVKRGGETVLEKILNSDRTGPLRGSGSPQTVSFNPTVHVEIGRVDSDVDVGQLIDQIRGRLLFEIREDLERLQVRGIDYLRG